MTAPAAVPGGGLSGLLGKLMATVRSEFRSDVLEFGPDDSVFGGAACRVRGCGRTARGRVLCQAPSAAVERPGTPGHPGVRRIDRSALAATTTEPVLPGARMRLRLGAGRHVQPARAAMATRRPPDLDAWLADPQPVKQPAPRDLPHPALPAVAASDVAVLPIPHQHLEGQRAPPCQRIRRPLRQHRVGQRDDSASTDCPHNCAWRRSTSCSAATTNDRASLNRMWSCG